MPQLEAAPNRQKTLTKPIRPFRGVSLAACKLVKARKQTLRPLRTQAPYVGQVLIEPAHPSQLRDTRLPTCTAHGAHEVLDASA